MFARYVRRSLSFLLALAMIFSMLPVQALAMETDGHDHDHVHSYTAVVTNPTCGTDGYTTYTCDGCDDSYTSDEVAATGEHTYESIVVAPTTEAEGYTQYTCSVCGDTYTDKIVEKEVEVSATVAEIQTRIDTILTTYLGTTSATLEEIQAAVAEMDDVAVMDAQFEILVLEEDMSFMTLTEADQMTLVENNTVFVDFCDVVMAIDSGIALFATTVEVLDGQLSITDSQSTGKISNGTYTATAKGSLLSKKTNTITITNNTANQAELKFDYTVSSANSFTIAGASAATSGSYTATVEAGGTVAISIQSKSGFSDLTVTLTLSNITLTAAAAASNVTFEYESGLGNITVGGAAVASGDIKEITFADGAELVATANGGIFLGWVNAEDGAILSKEASYTLKPAQDMTVKAAFAKDGGTPWFAVGATSQKSQSSGFLGLSKLYYYQVGTSYLFDDLNEAAVKASSDASNKTLVLMNNGTLPAGEYTIPAGVTLLVPFDNANTMYTTQVQSTGTYTTPIAYRTLTMADGANMTVNGGISISAKQIYASGDRQITQYGGAPVGGVGMVKMQGNSSITVNNGGVLYAYGFVTGSGFVTAKSGASVYEMFQIADFRGGTQSTDMDNGVFPISQYYIQNIEVPLTLEYGSKEYSYTTVYMSSADFGSSVAFIADKNAMFNLTSGSVTKRYDGKTDRLMVEANGNLTMSPVTLDVGGTDLNSKDYELGINGNITVRANSGSNLTINQDIALLPGSEIIVETGATCTLGANNVYVYDADQWGAYTSHLNQKFWPVVYAPGRTYNRTEADLVDAKIQIEGTIDATKGHVYTTAGGANVFSIGSGKVITTKGSQTVTHQLNQGVGYVEIPITPAKLKNSDGSYTETATVDGEYHYENGTWKWQCDGENHVIVDGEDVAPTCTESGRKVGICFGCGEVNETIPATGHTPGAEATCTTDQICTVCGDVLDSAKGHSYEDVVTPPTCEEEGYTTHTCSACGDIVKDSEVAATGHAWGEVTYTWKNDNASCTAKRVCGTCTEEETAEASVESAVTTQATCVTKQVTTYTATFGDDWAETQEKSVTGEINPDAHNWGETTYKWNDTAKTCTATRTCGNDGCSVVFETASASMSDEQKIAPTCMQKEVRTYTASFDVAWAEPQTKDYEGAIDPEAHTWGTTTYTWSDDYSYCTAKHECTNTGCGEEETEKVTASVAVTAEATCSSGKVTTNTADFKAEWAETQKIDFVGEKDPNVHTWSEEISYIWQDATRTCTAQRECTNPDCSGLETLEPETTSSKITTEANCVTKEAVTYTAVFESWGGSDSKVYYGEIDSTAHTWSDVSFEWTEDCASCTAMRTCTNGCGVTEEETVNATSSVTVEATCVTEQETTYTVYFTKDWIPEKEKTETVTGKKNPDAHSWGETEYTWDDAAKTYAATRTCTNGCNTNETATVKDVTISEKIVANCVTEGIVTYTVSFEESWAQPQAKDVNTGLDLTKHSWGETTYSWSNDGTLCTAKRVCSRSDEHVEKMDGTMTSEVTTTATCMKQEVITYIATFTDWAEGQLTNAVPGETNPTAHSWGETKYTWDDAAMTCAATRTCTNGCNATETATVTMTSEQLSAATCMQAEVRTFTAKFAEDWAPETQIKDYSVGEPDADAHAWGEAVVTWAQDGSECSAVRVCQYNQAHEQTASATVTPEITVEATCVTKQEITYTAEFTEDWAEAEPKVITGSIDATAHKWGSEITYAWSTDGKTCTASRVCEYNGDHVDTVEAVMTSDVTTIATCVDPEVITYTATFTDWAEAVKTNSVTGAVNPDAHDWGEASYNWESATDPCTAYRVCKHSTEHTETIDAIITTLVTTEADCITNEVVTYTATFSKDWAKEQTKDVIGEVNLNNHHNLIRDAVQDATCTEPGVQAGSHCDSCGFVEGNGVIPAKGHKWGTTVYTWSQDFSTCTATRTCTTDASHVETLDAQVEITVTEATCSAADVTTYTAVFETTEGNWAVTQTEEIHGAINSEAHDWNDPTYTWLENDTVCEAKRTCKHNADHFETAQVTMSQETTTEATCTQPEVITYTATFTEVWAETQKKPVTGSVKDDAHKWSTEITYSWSEDGKTCTASRVCEYNGDHVDTVEAEMTSKVTTTATCVDPEVITYTATFTGWAEAVKTNLVEGSINATAHDWADAAVTWADDGSSCTAERICKNSAEHVESTSANVTSSTTTATCTDPAVTTFTATFTVDWAKADPKIITGSVDETAHNWGETSYSWLENGTVCVAERTCEYNGEHTETATVTMSQKTTTVATCVKPEVITYTATFTEGWADTQTNAVTGSVNPNNHRWGDAEYSTWSEDGTSISAKRVCSYDGSHTEQAKVTITPEVTTEATCTVKGVTTYKAVFEEEWANKTLSNSVTGDYNKNNHKNIITDKAVEPTCTEAGKTEGSHCGDCGTVLVEQQPVGAKNHAWGDPVYTWSTDGKTCSAQRICSNDTRHVETAVATMSSQVTTEATCSTAQVTTYTANFDVEWAETQTNPVTGQVNSTNHTWGDAEYIWNEAGTICTAERVCVNDESHKETAAATMSSQVTTEATCIVPKVVTYTAKFAKDWAQEQTNAVTGEINANAHNWDETTYTWSEDGKTCTAERVCVNDANHKETAVGTITSKVTTEATCSVAEVVTYTAKFAENWTATQTKGVIGEINADVHNWNLAVVTWAEDGSSCTAVRTCTYNPEHQEEAAATVTSRVTTEATCTTKKVTTYSAIFDVAWADAESMDVIGTVDVNVHNWGKTSYIWSEDGKTCTAERVCVNDANHKETAIAVISSEVTTHATCTVAEVVSYTAVFTEDWAGEQTKSVIGEIDPEVHKWGEASYIWSEDGKICTAQRICDYDADHVDTTEAVMTSQVTTEATCVIEEIVTYTATFEETWAENQTNTVTGSVAPDNHVNIVEDEAVESTCTATGLTAGSHCDDCDEVLVAQTEVAMLEHEMLPATCTEPSKCKYECGLTEGEALGHTEVIDEEVPAFCEEEGLTEGKHCSVCDKVLIAQNPIPKLGHNIVTYEAKKPTYSNVGWDAYEACTRCSYTTYNEIPMLEVPPIEDYETFLENLALLEELAYAYMLENPGKDPANLVIKYIRTGVDRYNSGSWGIMAGYEDAGFAEFVAAMEDQINSEAESEDQMLAVTSLKNIKNFNLPNGDHVDLGHMFGTMDITYHNNFGLNHADVAGWAGDLVDLLSTVDRHNVTGTLDEMIADISANYLCKAFPGESDLFSLEDMYGDLDGYYVMKELQGQTYENGTLTAIIREYFTEDLTLEDRAEYFLNNRLGGVNLRNQIRDAVYNVYTGNKVIATLEGTREFNNSDLSDLRKACCYAFADYICKLAGDYVDAVENSYFTVFQSEYSKLAPGITQEIKYATTADNKQMVYYVATADLTRDDVHLYANYNNNDPAAGWAMQRVLDQANAAQEKYGNPESEHYIPNYNVIVSTNGAGYNMQTGEPGGLLVMNGVEYHPIDGNGFFGILKDGTPVIGTTAEYNTIYKDQVMEGIAGFGATLVKDGEICVNRTENYYTDRASRTAVGITKTGKVVLMVLDGRQEPFSCGGSMQEIAQVMREAGCIHAINLDGGGSTTYVAKQEGAEELAVVSRPSDGFARSVSASLMMVSTAPSSTAFDHAVLETDTDYLTVNTSIQITPNGVSATGNAAELPEDAFWAVSDERWGTITEDGVFTALRNGSVDVYLMQGEKVLGTKTLNIVLPDNVYFTKDNLDAIFGSRTTLPVKALYEGKEVAIQAADLVFSFSNEKAGVIDGFDFIAAEESGLKNVKITAALANDENVSDTITVALYKQGETSFDFEQAVGGTRQMAWDRQVTNATTEDMVTYDVIDPEEEMVTSYTFAIDMRAIPIPYQLEDLIYMLPGADAADASAWGFLMQLAERVSVLTEVKPVIEFDPNFDVDISELKLINDYFELSNTEYDEVTNKVTLTLNWIDQTAAIDPETANPLCIVSGIKLTPKEDAAWTEDESLSAVNAGQISYNIYLRANALYSFAQKEENQKIYGLKPFVNPNDESEKGGSFGSVYATFEDTYTLNNALKNGWVNVDGGYAYYVNNKRMTGISEVEGLYYDFGENGVNAGKTTYTGLFFDTEVNAYRYTKLGVLTSGWNLISNEWHYFKASTMTAATGSETINGVTFEFEEDGKVVSGVWEETPNGARYWFGPDYYRKEWQVIDGNRYYFTNGYALKNYQYVKCYGDKVVYRWYNFGDDGIARDIEDGLYTIQTGRVYYFVDNVHLMGLRKVEGDYYFFCWDGYAATGEKYAWETHCDLPCDTYMFGPDGKMANNVVLQREDGYYYYVLGKVCKTPGLTKIGDDYYFVSSIGRVATGIYYCWATNCELPCGNYEFAEDGKMLHGIVQKADGPYHYTYGNLDKTEGLTKVGEDYCFVTSDGKCVTGTYYADKTNCDLPIGTYEFGADGKMIRDEDDDDNPDVPGIKNGLVQESDGIYYYVNGKFGTAGITKIGDYYYFVSSKGRVATGTYYCWATNCEIPCGTYEFDAQGRMLNVPGIKNGLVQESDGIYYYVNGKFGTAGITKIGDYYYFVSSKGRVATGTYYCWATNCEIPCGSYEFDSQGRMLNVPVIKNGLVQEADGIYYYVNGKFGTPGITKIGGYYYFVSSIGRVATGTYYCWATNCEIPCGSYEFDSQGRMLNVPGIKNGLVQESDGIYYYVDGKFGPAGITKIGDDYYFVSSIGRVATGSYYCWATNCELPCGTYEFDADGKMIR